MIEDLKKLLPREKETNGQDEEKVGWNWCLEEVTAFTPDIFCEVLQEVLANYKVK